MEDGSHIPLFFSIFKTIIKEEYNGEIPESIINKAHEMIKVMVDAEKRWARYASKGLLGFTDKTIDIFVENRANVICRNLKIPKLYEEHKVDPIGKLLKERLKGGEMEARPNFFEVNAAEYSKGTIENDY